LGQDLIHLITLCTSSTVQFCNTRSLGLMYFLCITYETNGKI
jgi:hypothetical protein